MLAPATKHQIKVAVAHLLYYTGVLHLWQAIALHRKTVVLMYHRVLPADERQRTGSHPGIVVDRDTFQTQMELISRRFRPLTFQQFADRMSRGEPFDSSSCLITFDDGWRDNLTHALPVLQRYRLPALIFLPVNFIGTQRLFWRERLTHLLVQAANVVVNDPQLQSKLRDLLRPHGLDGLADRAGDSVREAVIHAIACQPHLRAPQAESLMAAIETEFAITLDPNATPDAFINWEQVDFMASRGVTFGGHGAEHRQLAECSLEEAAADIIESKQTVNRRLGGDATAFSYPNGSLSADVMEAVRSAGFSFGFTTRNGPVRRGDAPLSLRRINIHEDMTSTPPMFLARVVGLF